MFHFEENLPYNGFFRCLMAHLPYYHGKIVGCDAQFVGIVAYGALLAEMIEDEIIELHAESLRVFHFTFYAFSSILLLPQVEEYQNDIVQHIPENVKG